MGRKDRNGRKSLMGGEWIRNKRIGMGGGGELLEGARDIEQKGKK